MTSVYPRRPCCPIKKPAIVRGVGVLKAFLKLGLLLLVGAAIAGVIFLVKRLNATTEVSYEEWPSVPRKPTN